jgi:PPOX class probable F420-dependent enzyme
MTNGTFAALAGHNYMSLTTFRKTGEAVPTPVWFAEQAGKLYMLTETTVGKTKRIRNNPQVEVSPCDMRGKILGEKTLGVARILNDEEGRKANQLLTQKYGLQKRLIDLGAFLTRRPYVFIEISPR